FRHDVIHAPRTRALPRLRQGRDRRRAELDRGTELPFRGKPRRGRHLRFHRAGQRRQAVDGQDRRGPDVRPQLHRPRRTRLGSHAHGHVGHLSAQQVRGGTVRWVGHPNLEVSPVLTQPYTVVDAFTSSAFSGNPAAVVVLDSPADEPWMRLVAREFNLSETAFTYPEDAENNAWRLRWFTPAVEVD